MKKKKICVVTGSRAEYGLLYPLMKKIKNEKNFELQIIITGTHFSNDFGYTVKEIEKDGFSINKKVEMLLSSDTPAAITKSTGIGMIGFADVFKEIKPNAIIILGDRYEMLSTASAALFAKIPILHIHGGELTKGAFDDAIRHSITKMSWWHFVATEEYKKRVIQMGENPDRVFVVGGMGVDRISKSKLLKKNKLENKMGFKFNKNNFLFTYHPVTLEKSNLFKKIQEVLNVLSGLKDTFIIFTAPNSDTYGRKIYKIIYDFVKSYPKKSVFFKSMGHINYLSTMQFVDCVIGNSSSGLVEAPTFKIGTINIGNRQSGRIKAKSIIDCNLDKSSLKKALRKLYSKKFKEKLKNINNPYGQGRATEKILNIIKSKSLPKVLMKDFYDL